MKITKSTKVSISGTIIWISIANVSLYLETYVVCPALSTIKTSQHNGRTSQEPDCQVCSPLCRIFGAAEASYLEQPAPTLLAQSRRPVNEPAGYYCSSGLINRRSLDTERRKWRFQRVVSYVGSVHDLFRARTDPNSLHIVSSLQTSALSLEAPTSRSGE